MKICIYDLTRHLTLAEQAAAMKNRSGFGATAFTLSTGTSDDRARDPKVKMTRGRGRGGAQSEAGARGGMLKLHGIQDTGK